MTNTLKFRAWNRIVKRWQYFTLPDLEKQKGKIQWQNIDISQYTGKEDKNGTPIYGDDIINAPGFCGIARVEYGHPVGAAFCVGTFELGIIDEADLEVIGNIYENPELLTQPPTLGVE